MAQFLHGERTSFQAKFLKQMFSTEKEYAVFYKKYQDIVDKAKIEKEKKRLATISEEKKTILRKALK